ncbi:MAG: M48 family metalloprotease [Candidatus Babeliales bacterium]
MKKMIIHCGIITFILSSIIHTTNTYFIPGREMFYLATKDDVKANFDETVERLIKDRSVYEEAAHNTDPYLRYLSIAQRHSIDPSEGRVIFAKNHLSTIQVYPHINQFILYLDHEFVDKRHGARLDFLIAHELSHYKQELETYSLTQTNIHSPFQQVFNKLPNWVTKSIDCYYQRQNEFDADLRAVLLLKSKKAAIVWIKGSIAFKKTIQISDKKTRASLPNVKEKIKFSCHQFLNRTIFSTHPSPQARIRFLNKHASHLD